MRNGLPHSNTENFSSGLTCCGDVFDLLPGSKLILAPCAFCFVDVLPAPDCPYNEFWDGRLGAFVALADFCFNIISIKNILGNISIFL